MSLPFALLLLCLALLLARDFVALDHTTGNLGPLIEIAKLSTSIIYQIVTLILAVGVILEDPPKGTTAFWLTRPHSRRVIAMEKLCFLAVVILIPVLVNLVVIACCGAGPRILAVAAASGIVDRTPVVLALAAIAITAETFGQFAITGILILIGTGIATGITVALIKMHSLHTAGVTVGTSSAHLESSRILVVQVAVAVLSGLIVVWRYLCRHGRLSVAVVSAAAFASMLTAVYWPWDFLSRAADPIPQVNDVAGRFSYHPRLRPSAGGTDLLEGNMPSISLPSGEVVVPEDATNVTVTWPSGESIPEAGHFLLSPSRGDRWEIGAVIAAVAPATILNLPHAVARRGASLTIPVRGRVRDRLEGERGKLSGTVYAAIDRLEFSGGLPLSVGSRASWGIRQVRVDSIEASATGASAVVRVALSEGFYPSNLANAIDRSGRIFPTNFGSGYRFLGAADSNGVFVLVNGRRNEALLASILPGEGQRPDIDDVAGYAMTRRNLEFVGPGIDQAWLEGATLVRYRLIEVGRTTGTFEADDVGLGQPEF